MGFVCGIIGMPNVGKSTVFNALTGAAAEVSNYPFCTISPNRGMAPVPDSRLEALGRMLAPEKLTPTCIEFMDVAGLVEGASSGEGLGNTFLGHIRAVDALVHVVRFFGDSRIVHVAGEVNPAKDIGLIETELILADLEIVDKRLDKLRRLDRIGQNEAREEKALLETLREHLARGIPARRIMGEEWKKDRYKEWGLLTSKPVLYVANIGEEHLEEQDRILDEIREGTGNTDAVVIPLCAKLEEELLRMEPEEQEKFRQDLHLGRSGFVSLVEAGYAILALITFYTIVGKEVRAWTLRQGDTLYKAAGKIHSDMQKGFIRAEVFSFNDFLQSGSEHAARDKGLIRVEGREYIVADGDIVRIRFQ